MAIRDFYTEAEKKAIERTNQTQDRYAGLADGKHYITESSLKNQGAIRDWYNPLWRDDKYAADTRWGSIIGIPTFGPGAGAPHIVIEARGDIGFLRQDTFWIGEDWEFFQPIRAGDEISIRRRSHHVEDITDLNGKGPRVFKLLAHDYDYINQRDELVSTTKLYLQPTYIPGPPEKPYNALPLYKYSQEELEYIDRIADQEEIRGADTRCWEDVDIGEAIKPVVKGPIDLREQVNSMGGFTRLPMRDQKKQWPWELVKDPVRGTVHDSEAIHLSDRVAQLRGFDRAILGALLGTREMIRVITHWMGDDGFIRKFYWRYTADGAVGDTLITRGRIINKRVDQGEHLAELKVWSENLRGYVFTGAVASVSLPSR